jgi:hypothetical protein
MYESCEWYDIACGLKWLGDELDAWFLRLYDGFMSGLASIIEAIPVPDFLANMQTFSMPSGVAYFASAFEIPWGIAIIVTAYTARFILRRIPIIG